MSFLGPAMLWFALAAAVPLAIHLYHRRKRTQVDFSTNRFFTEAVIQSQRRMQLQRVWLMVLRIAACLALAFAVSRPFVQSSKGGAMAGRRDVALLVDDTLSMRARLDRDTGRGGDTAFERARQAALTLVEQLQPGDRVAVVTASGRQFGEPKGGGEVALTADRGMVAKALRELEPTRGDAEPYDALRKVSEILESARSRAPMAVAITDMQAAQWPETPLPRPAAPMPLVAVQVAPPPTRNVFVEDARLSPAIILPGRPNNLEVRLRNSSDQQASVTLVVKMDGRAVAQRTLALGPRSGAVEQVPVSAAGPDGGTHASASVAFGRDRVARLHVQVDSRDDGLDEDNVFNLTARVAERLPVLVIDGQTATNPRQRSSFYVATALQSLGHGGSMSVEVMAPSQAPWRTLSSYRVVVLCGVADLPAESMGFLRAYVRGGGGLLVFLGEPLDRAFYTGAMINDADGGLLPGEVRDRIVKVTESDPLRVRDVEWSHEVFRRYEGELRAALAGISVRRAWRVAPRNGAVLATMDEGIPFLVERRYGDGAVLAVCTSPEPEWSELALRRNFVSLLNRWVGYLASGSSGHGYEVGREIVLPEGGAGVTRVERPDGSVVDVSRRSVGERTVLYLPAGQVDRQGFYAAVNGGADIVVAVNTPRSESSAEVADIERLRRGGGDWDLRLADKRGDPTVGNLETRESWAGILTAGSVRITLWDGLLWALLALLAIEPFLANRIGARAGDDGGKGGA